MNKELIKKYKAEFDWWLDGGSLRYKDDKGWDTDDFFLNWSCDSDDIKAIVKNDEYVEYRMAEADGKIVQMMDDGGRWFACSEPGPDYSLPPSLYRVKHEWHWAQEASPEKPVFCIDMLSRCLYAITSAYNDKRFKCTFGEVYCEDPDMIKPILIGDLHPFQREGWIKIDELAKLSYEFAKERGYNWNGSAFADWLKERKQ